MFSQPLKLLNCLSDVSQKLYNVNKINVRVASPSLGPAVHIGAIVI